MIKALKLLSLTKASMRKMNASTALHVIASFLKGAPYGALLLVLWELFNPPIGTKKIIGAIAFAAAALILELVLAMAAYTKNHIAAYSLTADTRLKLGEHLRRLSLGFFKKRDPGDITALLLQDLDKVEQVFSHLYNEIISSFVIAITIASFMFFTDWRLALSAIIVVPIAIPVLLIGQKIIAYFGKKHIKSRNHAVSRFLEYLQGIKVIKAFNLKGEKFKNLDDSFKKLRSDSVKMEAAPGPLILSYGIILELGLIVILFVGAHLLFGGTLSVTVFLTFLVLSVPFYTPLLNIGLFTSEIRYMSIGADRIISVLKTEPLHEPEEDEKLKKFDVEFRNVTFKYHSTDVLKNVSFTVPEHSITGLVGPSGSGKTTITSLIARFWDVDGGEIFVGGRNIKELKTDRLLSYISTVFQDVYLFHDTIYNNIKIGKSSATQEEIVAASKAAQCHEFIEKMPDGYESMVGEGGSTLSGGEKQRISIARAILKDVPIILLDEATASLDPENENLVQNAINRLVKSKTLIVIAHNLSTIRNADQILVIDKGKIVEAGKHDDIVNASGLYSHLWEEQNRARGWKFGTRARLKRLKVSN